MFIKIIAFSRLREEELATEIEKVAVYEDMLKVKDEIIIKLTHEISDVERQSSGSCDQPDTTQNYNSRDSVLSMKSDKSISPIDEREYEKLKVNIHRGSYMSAHFY